MGAGGLGSQLVERVLSDPANGTIFRLTGLYDDRASKGSDIERWSDAFNYQLSHYPTFPPPISRRAWFVPAIGNPFEKENMCASLKAWGCLCIITSYR